jgi:thiamine-phosphate pyrophosphorylase
VTAAGRAARRVLVATRVYLVVTPTASAERDERALCAALSTGLVGMVQLRAKDAGDDAVLAAAARLRPPTKAAGALFLLNDRPDLAERAGADGAHVGEDDVPPDRARALLGGDRILGVSTHDEAEVRAAAAAGIADYLGLGPCFATGTKRLARAPGGPGLLRRCLPLAGGLPVFPIGGIGPANAADLARAGADRVAVGSAVLGAEDPAAAVRGIARALER